MQQVGTKNGRPSQILNNFLDGVYKNQITSCLDSFRHPERVIEEFLFLHTGKGRNRDSCFSFAEIDPGRLVYGNEDRQAEPLHFCKV